jgi:hypothetical protein
MNIKFYRIRSRKKKKQKNTKLLGSISDQELFTVRSAMNKVTSPDQALKFSASN